MITGDAEISAPYTDGNDRTLSLGRCLAPVVSLDIELSEALPHLGSDDDADGTVAEPEESVVFALLRLHGAPVGTVLFVLPRGGMTPAQLAERIWAEAGPEIARHAVADGLPAPGSLDPDGYTPAGTPECLRRRALRLQHAPEATVVVATRERPAQLSRCLDSLARMDYPAFDVIVVDNDPQTDATADLVRSGSWPFRLEYVRENRRGLAAAHNRGVQVSTGSIIALTDDDVEVDSGWLAALAEGFAEEGVAAVTGLIHPAELRTRAQLLLEQHARFGKGFVPTLFDLTEHRPADPLYPFTAGRLGSGANMAFDAAVLHRLGGFDPAMGTGTASRGGDDLVALFSVIASGYRLAYQPAAVVFHYHRDDLTALDRQAYGYGVGLGAYLTNVMLHHPLMAFRLLVRAPTALASTLRLDSEKNRVRYDAWPTELARLERKGIMAGPGAYLRSRWNARGAERPGG